MKLTKVTITGADDKTSTEELQRLSSEFPFVEWGILFSQNKEGQQRYPSKEKINQLAESGLLLSAHFCGWYARQVLEKQNFSLIDNLPAFKRIQLNYNFANSALWNLIPLIEYATNHPEKSIILQWNKSNKPWLYSELLAKGVPTNIHFLYDSSGGRGVALTDIQDPFANYTGYSGGLSPENINGCLYAIQQHDNINDAWVDMESGVRTDNEFDISKVSEALSICKKYI